MLILGARKQVRHVVDEETYSKYEEFTLASALNAMPDIRWCPKPDCKNAMVRTYRPIPCVASCAPIRSSKSTLVCITACSDRRRGQPHDGVFQFGVPLQLLLQVQGGVACRYVRLSGVWRGVAWRFVGSHCAARPLWYRCHVRAVPAVAKGELGGRRQVRAAPSLVARSTYSHN